MRPLGDPLNVEADLHCHLLPDWDDGPRTLEQALEMARRAVAAGLKQILVTPHVGRAVGAPARRERPAAEIPGATRALEQTVWEAGIELSLVPGAELTFSQAGLPQQLATQPWLTVGGQGRYILIESVFGCWPRYANQFLYRLALAGVTAMIAHPERLPDVQRDISILEASVRQGALLQITARSFLGEEERPRKQCAYRLLEAGMVGLVASDAHSPQSVLPHEVREIIQARVGHAAAHLSG